MTSGFFDAADGLKLYGDWYAPKNAEVRAGILVVHGYADHGGRYAELSCHLADHGYAVFAFDYRGHGQAGGARGHCDSFEEYLRDLERAIARAQMGIGDRPLALFAHSHGGLIALRALCEPGRMPPNVKAVALSSPFLGLAMKVSPVKTGLARVASRLVPRLSLPNGIDPSFLTHDEKAIAARRVDRFCHSVATARWFREATAAQAYVLAHASRIALPTLWLLAGDDRIADVEVARRAYEAAGGKKELKIYPGFYHEVWNEDRRGLVFSDLDRWLSREVLPT